MYKQKIDNDLNKYEKIIKKDNKYIFLYYFKNYYEKYKENSLNYINEDIFDHANFNELDIWDKLEKCIILYPSELYKEIEKIKDKDDNNCLITYLEYNNKY